MEKPVSSKLDRNFPAPENNSKKPRLLEQLRAALAARRFALATMERYVEWCKQFILFHNKRHPETMGQAEVTSDT